MQVLLKLYTLIKVNKQYYHQRSCKVKTTAVAKNSSKNQAIKTTWDQKKTVDTCMHQFCLLPYTQKHVTTISAAVNISTSKLQY